MKPKPRWNTMESLILWLKQWPPSHRYNYMDCEKCLAAQYCREHRQPYYVKNSGRSFRRKLELVAGGNGGAANFGAALGRAKEMITR